MDELLDRARPERAVPPVDGGGYDPPAERRIEQVGGDLAPAQRAGGEVAQRNLTPDRLVDCQRPLGAGADLGQVGVVGTVRHQAAGLDRPPPQQAERGGFVGRGPRAHG